MGLGLRACRHEVPFQRMIRVLFGPFAQALQPTAQAFPAEVAATPKKVLPAGPGLDTCFHDLPFQCKISVEVPSKPTAQALRADVAATPTR